MPRFSVLLPTYNQSHYLVQALDALLAQSFEDFEIFVVDDGSTDDTPRVLEPYGSRITILRQPNQGPEIARNKAAEQSRGEYLVMLDHDDLLTPHALATYDCAIRAFDAPPLLISSMMRFNDGMALPIAPEEPLKVLKFPDFISRKIPLHLSNSRIILRKDVFQTVGGYGNPHSTRYNVDDFNLILKVGTYGPCIFIRHPCTLLKRDHAQAISRNLKATAEAMQGLVRAEHAGFYPGGKRRRHERYANIGGVSSAYAVRYCWPGGERVMAFRLLWDSAPMIAVALRKRLLRPFEKPPQEIDVPPVFQPK